MAGTGEALEFSVASVVEDVLQQHGKRFLDVDLASRKAEEASLRRFEAAGWLRKTIGVVAARDLPAEPSEEDMRLGLRSGIVLCNALNKIHSGAILKVVEAPSDSVAVPDGAALSAYQYFENVRNFLVAVEEMGLPTFEASDLEQGGKSSRIVNCILALKSYNDWKKGGGHGSWKFGGNMKPSPSGKQFVRKNSEPFMNCFSRTSSVGDRSLDSLSFDQCSNGNDLNELCNSHPLHMLVRELLADKKQEDIPTIVENMLSKVTEEFERRLASQNEQMKTPPEDINVSGSSESLPRPASVEIKVFSDDVINKKEDKATSEIVKEEFCIKEEDNQGEELKGKILKRQVLVEQQHRELQELKHTLSTAREDIQLMQVNYQEEVMRLGKHLHGLAQAASGYQKVLEENRKLYNQVQDLRGNIRVYCRVRPFLPGQPNRLSSVDHIDEGNITILTPSKYGKEGRKSFTFNKVFDPSTTQEEVFSDTQPLIRSVLDGYNVCIFAYGQTGAGKTYTMSGPDDLTEESMGVNYRALSDLFLISEQRKNVISYDVNVQMLEIYNEQVRDLLVTDGANRRLEIRNGSQKGLNVPDANLVPVASTSDVIYLMNLGHKNRAVSSTAMNDRSSRSHSCLTVHVQGRDLTSGTTLRGCMHLVDLAGSERVDKSEAVGDRLKEAQHINKSLSALGDVISSLAQKNSHVPYRNSKLTQLLQDALGGQAKTLMFVHISPDTDAIGETISTLKFAERVSTVELGAARTNKDSADVKELKEQIAVLKAALARKGGGTPDSLRSPSTESSPSHYRLGNSRQPMEDVGNIEVRNNSASKQNKQSDLQDMLMNSEQGFGNWVDKVMVNKQNGLQRDENPLGQWEEDNSKLPEMFYQKNTPDPSKICPEQPLSKMDSQDNDASRNRYEAATTDESDDHDTATSDCSEPDFLWQFNVPKVTNAPNALSSKLKKPSPMQAKSPEVRRSLIPPPPSRRLSSGGVSPVPKTGRQPASADGRRKSGGGGK